jgi:hypothetical protein
MYRFRSVGWYVNVCKYGALVERYEEKLTSEIKPVPCPISPTHIPQFLCLTQSFKFTGKLTVILRYFKYNIVMNRSFANHF